MKSNYLLWIIVAGVILFGGYYWMNRPNNMTSAPTSTAPTTTPAPTTKAMMTPIVVPLLTQNGLGQSGTATFTQNGDGKVVVTLAMTGGNFTTPQPAHIHVGSCPNPGAVKYPLTNIVGGKSETTLNVSWADLENSGDKLALNVHKSASEISVYTACGDLPVKAASAAAPTTTPANNYGY